MSRIAYKQSHPRYKGASHISSLNALRLGVLSTTVWQVTAPVVVSPRHRRREWVNAPLLLTLVW